LTTNVTWQADLGIDILDHFDPVGVTDVVLTYTLVYTNYGPSDAIDLSLIDTLPENVAYVSEFSDPACSLVYGGKFVTCDLPNLPALQHAEIVVAVEVNDKAVAPLENQVDITSGTPDPGPHPNTAVEYTDIDLVHPAVEWIAPVEEDKHYTVIMRPGLAISLVVTATDNLAIDYVQFRLWDPVDLQWIYLANVYESGPDGYTYVWVIQSVRDLFPGRDQNQVFAYAYDIAGNSERVRIFLEPIYPLFLSLTLK
jgi:uncharacterized repeat protein (TIGR01451 family)